MAEADGELVVVGVDGSESALDAVRAAAAEAVLRRRPLVVVHAYTWGLMPPKVGRDPALKAAADRLVAAAVEVAEKAAPGITVTGEIHDGTAAGVLLRYARRATMIVIGDRGLGGFTGLLVGSVAVQVAEHASCPVLVVKGDRPAAGPVVVGVDGSPTSDRATAFAFAEAEARGADLVAVLAWRHQRPSPAADEELPLVYDEDDLVRAEARVLDTAVDPWRERHPDVPVTRRLRAGRADKALIEESRAAQLVVVGARGRGGFKGLLLGSVSHAVLHHAECPVAIVRR